MPVFKILVDSSNGDGTEWVSILTRGNTLDLARKAAESHFSPRRVRAVFGVHAFCEAEDSREEDRKPIWVD